MPFNVWVVLFSFSTLQGLFLGLVFLFDTRGRRAANQMLAALLGLIALLHGAWLLQAGGWVAVAPAFVYLTGPFWLLLGPVLYAYVRTLTGQRLCWSWTLPLHAMPFALHLGLALHRVVDPASYAAAAYVAFLRQPLYNEVPLIQVLIHLVMMGQLLGYTVVSLRQLKRYQQTYEAQAAGDTADLLTWTRRLLLVFLGYVVYETITGTLLLFTQAFTMAYVYFSVLLLASFLVAIAYAAIRYPDVLFPALTLAEAPAKYERSSLTEPYLIAQAQRLHALMAAGKPYRQGDLKLNDLAGLLDIPPHHLTQVLNQEVGLSFNAYVNGYRIDEAQRRLLDPAQAHLSILGIALEVGFNSKTTFNRLFKQHTGLTPSQFIAQHPVAEPVG